MAIERFITIKSILCWVMPSLASTARACLLANKYTTEARASAPRACCGALDSLIAVSALSIEMGSVRLHKIRS